MKGQSVALFTKARWKMFSRPPLSTLAIAFALIPLFILFRVIEKNETKRALDTIESLLRNESMAGNTFALSKSLLDLERLRFISCAKLSVSDGLNRPFYDSTSKEHCLKNRFLKNALEDSIEFKAINGYGHQLTVQLPLKFQSYLLELLTYVVISGSILVYSRRLRFQMAEVRLAKALTNLSKQVAHDIRSPLAALNTVISISSELPEDQQRLIAHATQRINDIANELLRKNVGEESDASQARQGSPVMLFPLLDSILSEKRAQFHSKSFVQFRFDYAAGYTAFARIDQTSISRVLSNLLNNAAEAVPYGGSVHVTLSIEEKFALIKIEDNGIGMPQELLGRLGTAGVTYGKENSESGSGLGIPYAFRVTSEAGGRLIFNSSQGQGTVVSLFLPLVEPPSWLALSLPVSEGSVVISVDDDFAIHDIWKSRINREFSSYIGLRHIGFTAAAEVPTNFARTADSLFLIDFSLRSGSENGLSLIKRLAIGDRSILVTSNFTDPFVVEEAQKAGIKILPKALVPLIPFSINLKYGGVDGVVIDNDASVLQTWRFAAKAKKKNILTFEDPSELLSGRTALPSSTPIYIDVELQKGLRGEVVAEQLSALGYTDLFLATGYDPGSLLKPACVKAIVGKTPFFL